MIETHFLAVPLALLLDAAVGEPRRFHPLVAFGSLAGRLERRWNDGCRINGVVAWGVLVLPPSLLAGAAWLLPVWLALAVNTLGLWLVIALRSLSEHALAVAAPLAHGDLSGARSRVAGIVSRETGDLDESEVARATIESTLENGSDAVFASLFWFLLGGLPLAVAHRLINTLDAMWGYRTRRFEAFGWFAARADDWANYVPARLTALTYALAGRWSDAVRCWREQGPRWHSPNAGVVMAAGAGALGVAAGGRAMYHGTALERPPLGCGEPAAGHHIAQSVSLVRRGVMLWGGTAIMVSSLA